MGNLYKLEELRARTDRELVALIDSELNRVLQLAAAGMYWAGAGKACAEARTLLPKVYNLGERLRLERKLGELERSLQDLAAGTQSRVRSATG
jgi:hypothetical protein